MNINWKELPHDHSGRWSKKFISIMNPEDKVTWPQLMAEFVIYWRSKIIKTYPSVSKGAGWSKDIQKQVRALNQQASAICNYFPHPDDEPLVIYAFKKYFREQRPLKLGGFRKTRFKINEKTGRENCLITQEEKDIVLGLAAELDKAIITRESYAKARPVTPIEIAGVATETIYSTPTKKPRRGTLAYALSLEQQVKNDTNKAE